MAELNSNDEPHVLPSKRKQSAPDADAESAKKHQVENCTDNGTSAAVEEKIINENVDEEEDGEEDYDGEDDVDSEDEEDDEDEDEDDDEVEHSNGRAEIDRKGKGIMKDVKGKGKLIEESEEDNSSDDDGASESDGDDDLSDDPLAEVDLDNILPSRTRRRTAPPGVRISNDKFTNDKDNDA